MTRDEQLTRAADMLWGPQSRAVRDHGRYRQFANADAMRAEGVYIPAAWAARCDEYLGPLGVGYVLTVTAGDEEAAAHVGPEAGYGFGWRKAGSDD
jgi:hypothetical protein